MTLTFLVTIIASAFFGYHYRQLHDTVGALRAAQEERKKPKVQSKATFLDPSDVVARAKWEHEQQMKKLNGDD